MQGTAVVDGQLKDINIEDYKVGRGKRCLS